MLGISIDRFSASYVWIGGIVGLAAIAILTAFRGPDPLRIPATPIDRVHPPTAEQWLFLFEVERLIPNGSSYTVLAPTRDEEMSLYMLSLGPLRRATALPSSYYGIETSAAAANARFILSYRCVEPKEALRLIARVPHGCLYSR